jgi:hypothetical protein
MHRKAETVLLRLTVWGRYSVLSHPSLVPILPLFLPLAMTELDPVSNINRAITAKDRRLELKVLFREVS